MFFAPAIKASTAPLAAPGKRVRQLALATALLVTGVFSGPLLAADAPALQREAQRLVHGLEGEVGVSMVHLQTGRAVHVNGQRAFPLASVMKLPVAVHILTLVDEGQLTLGQTVTLTEADIYPEMGGPMDLHLSAGSAISVRDLLHMMITVSDNNATDILLRLGGGTAAVNTRMQQLGIDGIRIDRYIWELLANYYGHPASQQQPLDGAGYAAVAPPRTGRGRLRGGLPPRTPVAHKTGTVGDVINDAGVITLPDGKGEVVIAVLMQSTADTAQRERTIADLARAAHDYFLFVE